MTTGLTSFSTDEDPHASSLASAPLPEPEVTSSADLGDVEAGLNSSGGEDSWRGEVAARLQRYRTRRKPSGPRYPSLLLPFDPPEYRLRPAAARSEGSSSLETDLKSTAQSIEDREAGLPNPQTSTFVSETRSYDRATEPEFSAKVIEFPRFAAIPDVRTSDLADPVMDRPRIVEAAEVLPPPPALGGMLIEPAYNPAIHRRAEISLPAPPATIVRRALAAAVDLAIVGVAMAAFTTVFSRLTGFDARANLLLSVGMLGAAGILLWMIYEFILLIYSGSTPGLRVARLELSGFDGKQVRWSVRRWRVLGSFLSALSAGLGFLWSFLDESGLCWHDRITKTYLKSTK